ncbi:Zinc finger CCHC-type [Arabidopsis thaliana x Arabidopsis arenosa]|uniref:Zinc finger CCHC-type n=1 Tax=Arabidopsis thaliana x Arabidopsis arenosa TaxID=1240361 RepID=A0A8T1Y8W0_9BRAS|nr:Zinc finger CCHC-type [Arabidopsis thaliana x Arabidopsis arenosa]
MFIVADLTPSSEWVEAGLLLERPLEELLLSFGKKILKQFPGFEVKREDGFKDLFSSCDKNVVRLSYEITHSTVFDGQNYVFWAARMRTTLMNKDLWEVVKDGVPESTTQLHETPGADKGKEAANWKALKAKDIAALQIIQHTVADVVFDKILSATSAHQAWKLLEHSYQGNEKVKTVRLQSLRREFENLKMKEGENVKAYSDRIQAVANQMRALGEGKSDFDLVVKMLASMPKSYASLSSLMEETKDLKTVTYAELIGSLEAHEKKFFPDEEEDVEGAFHARFKNLSTDDNGKTSSGQSSYKRRRWCGHCKMDNHNEDMCFQKHKRLRTCFVCGKPGHFSRECNARKTEQAQVNQEHDEEVEEEGEYHMFTARQADQESFEENNWLIDSGCTNHMTPNDNLFIKINKNIKVPIRIGNGAVLMSKGKGDVEVMTKKGRKVIRNVFLVPEITKNLLSVSQMIKNGYEVVFKQSSCIIHDQAGKKIAEVEMIKNSFHLKLSSIEETTMLAQSQNEKLRHQKVDKAKDSNLRMLQPYKQRFMMLEYTEPDLNNQQTSNPKGIIEKKSEIGNKYVEHQTKKNGAEAVKQKSVAEFKNQRGSETDKKEYKVRDSKEMVQGTKPNKMVIKEDTIQRIESSPESKREQKMIGEVISKDMKKIQDRLEEDAEKTHGKVKGSQESRHRGFNFQNSEATNKKEPSEKQNLKLQHQNKEEVKELPASGKSNVMKTGEINLDPEYLQKKIKLKSVEHEGKQNKIEETSIQEGATQGKREIKQSNSRMSYAEVLKSSPLIKSKGTSGEAIKTRGGNWNPRRSRRLLAMVDEEARANDQEPETIEIPEESETIPDPSESEAASKPSEKETVPQPQQKQKQKRGENLSPRRSRRLLAMVEEEGRVNDPEAERIEIPDERDIIRDPSESEAASRYTERMAERRNTERNTERKRRFTEWMAERRNTERKRRFTDRWMEIMV